MATKEERHEALKAFALRVAEALEAAGVTLAAADWQYGEEEVVETASRRSAVQVWKPGDEDVDENVADTHSAQMVAHTPDDGPLAQRHLETWVIQVYPQPGIADLYGDAVLQELQDHFVTGQMEDQFDAG